jgi:hypothetical protein
MKNIRLIGIDPGKAGAIVEILVEERVVRWMKLPYMEHGLLDSRYVKKNFELCLASYIYVEKLSPNKMFGCSNFAFGGSYNSCLDLVKYYPFSLVSPMTWQHRLTGSSRTKIPPKIRAASAFRKMNPNFQKIVKTQHEGLIDAFFIAYYAGLSNNVVMPTDFIFVEVV